MVTGSVHHVVVEFVVKASLKKMMQILWMTEFSLVLSVSINVGCFSPLADWLKAHLDSFLCSFHAFGADHVVCICSRGVNKLKICAKENWFCSKNCEKVHPISLFL